MAASKDDLLQEVGLPGAATTLSSPGYTISDTSITVESTANMPTATGFSFAIDRVETVNGVQARIEGTYCEFVGTVSDSTTITNLEKVFGDAQDYPAGATTRVYIPVAAERENRIVEWGLAHANQDGLLKDDSVGTAQLAAAAITAAEIQSQAVTFSKLLSTIFGGEVTTYANPGSAGGTFYYINLGGLKFFWGLTGSITAATNSNTSKAVTLPVGFFTAVQSSLAVSAGVGGTALIYANVQSFDTTTVTVGQSATVGSGTAAVSLFVVGT